MPANRYFLGRILVDSCWGYPFICVGKPLTRASGWVRPQSTRFSLPVRAQLVTLRLQFTKNREQLNNGNL